MAASTRSRVRRANAAPPMLSAQEAAAFLVEQQGAAEGGLYVPPSRKKLAEGASRSVEEWEQDYGRSMAYAFAALDEYWQSGNMPSRLNALLGYLGDARVYYDQAAMARERDQLGYQSALVEALGATGVAPSVKPQD